MIQSLINTLLDDIEVQGWGLIPQFLTVAVIAALRQDLLHRQSEGQFHQAAVGKGHNAQTHLSIRGDETMWWQDNDLEISQKTYYENINIVSKAINQAFFLGIQAFECHYACYPVGAFYQKHLDSFRKSNSRLISCILYLNEDWEVAQGGQLRIYEADNECFIDVFPLSGSLVCMRSDTVWHEVLPANRARYSITGWLCRSAF